jgi:hypothetical protein
MLNMTGCTSAHVITFPHPTKEEEQLMIFSCTRAGTLPDPSPILILTGANAQFLFSANDLIRRRARA